MDTVSDLVRQIQSLDIDPARRHHEFADLVRKFQDMACAFGVLSDFHLAEDAAQEAFLVAYKDLSKLD